MTVPSDISKSSCNSNILDYPVPKHRILVLFTSMCPANVEHMIPASWLEVLGGRCANFGALETCLMVQGREYWGFLGLIRVCRVRGFRVQGLQRFKGFRLQELSEKTESIVRPIPIETTGVFGRSTETQAYKAFEQGVISPRG